MRRKLLDATVECLLERGYAGTTTTLVSERAGVSRGAQLHHYPKKTELVRAAVEHIFDRRLSEFLVKMEAVPHGADRVDAAIDLLWEAFSASDSFYPSLELIVAARTDPDLAEAVSSMTLKLRSTIQRTFEELFTGDGDDSALPDSAPKFAFALMDGLALHHMASPDDENTQEVLSTLKQIAALLRSLES
jgi:AcrR family transcriptional regulator